ncbi:MAG: hypothetical protein KatS3mg009_1831 [Acidimicrobiia bacterium]|nr:MAG: hypothetical protein KatS3mg009_1831 [Acidimicrobiia bacterium]
MATKKIRVYELARELGVDNAVVVELANELKIGVKSHSSSIDEPSADRVRRLADSRGLKKAPEPPPAPAPEPAAAPAAAAPAEAPAAKPGVVRSTHRVVRAGGAGARPETEPARATPAAAPPAAPAPAAPAEEGPARPAAPPERPAAAAPPPAPAAPPERPAAAAPGERPRPPVRPPVSQSGKPVPPPPGQRIPPPPPPPRGPVGTGPRGAPARPGGGPRGGPGPAGGGFGRGGGRGGPGGGFGGVPSGPGGVRAGAPGRGRGGPGGPGGPGGRGRPGGPRRRKKRRRDAEELLPAEQRLSPADAPVPEGEIVVPRGITIQELAPKLNRTPADLVRLLFEAGEMVTATASLADEMVELIAETLGAQVLIVEPGSEQEVELLALLGAEEEEDEALLEPRPPVVTVMGHVDHGKTTLLDTIRSTNVVAGEAGGITQHIGAYQVERGDRRITFIDTPGHEAFTAMRLRGAQVTDIAILVVAADDGVMPQTVEAISHARAAEVPIVVAVTKVDRDDADPTRVRQQLVEQELVPEEWGGATIVVDVAAPAGRGVDELLDAVLLVADAEIADELVANPKKPAVAYVLESNLDPGRGPVVTALVQEGTLRVGDTVVAGPAWGRVRAMFDEHGRAVTEAGPSVPVTVLGLDDVPLAGDDLRVAPSDKVARTVAEARAQRRKAAAQRSTMMLSGGARLEDVFALVQRGEVATLNLIVKADVQGSLEALTDALKKLDQEHDEVRLSFVHRGVGGISESDINLAVVSNATVIGFNVRPDRKARELAEREGVELRLYEVIYNVLEDVSNALVGLLKPEYEEVVTGEAEVREVFSVPRVGKVAGCFVTHGVITRGSKVRFLREGTIIWKGQIASLKRFKDDVREVREGFECGIGLENFQDLKAGDVIETYEEREIARTA